MKKIILLSAFFLVFKLHGARAQTLSAHYSVAQDIIGPVQGQKLATIESTGYLFKKGGQYLYYERPGYLKKYPDGNITIEIGASNTYSYTLCVDTLQSISYTNADSLSRIYRPQFTGSHGPGVNYRQKYEADYFNWVVLPETKVINGLKCQKATMSIRNLLQWIVWFTPKVQMQGGIGGIIGVPGLVVEAECPPLHTRYSLLDFSESTPLNDAVFQLKELAEPYVQVRPLLKANLHPVGKSKFQKQAELTNQ
jgi:GLPGLI family protein